LDSVLWQDRLAKSPWLPVVTAVDREMMVGIEMIVAPLDAVEGTWNDRPV